MNKEKSNEGFISKQSEKSRPWRKTRCVLKCDASSGVKFELCDGRLNSNTSAAIGIRQKEKSPTKGGQVGTVGLKRGGLEF